MTFLPIVERELRVRSRRKSTFRIRMAGALAASLFAGSLLVFSDAFFGIGQGGMFIFSVLSFLAFLFSLTEGARTTADCLSSEKREGTLGLLFLTDLKGYDVVLGKLMAASLNSIYMLLSIFPALAVPLTLGGVTGGEFWRVVLVLILTLFLSLALGMLISAAVKDERAAWTVTLGLMFAVTILPMLPPLRGLGSHAFPWVISPGTALGAAYDSGFQNHPETFWKALASMVALTAACLASASLILPHRWQDQPRRAPSQPPTPPGAPLPSQDRRIRRRLQLESNPVSWLAGAAPRQNRWLWTLILTACGGALALSAATGFDPNLEWPLFFSALVLHLILSLWIAAQSCHALSGARASGALEMLLCTPLQDREIADGHWMALQRLFHRPALTLALTELILLSGFFLRKTLEGEDPVTCLLLFGFFGAFLFTGFLDMLAVGRFGLWMGLKWDKPGPALTRTVLYILAIPAVFACCYFLWPVLGSVKNLVFINYGKDQLKRNFRKTAAQPPGMETKDLLGGGPPSPGPGNPLPPVIGI